MAKLRISVSLDERTLNRLDRWVREGIYPSRSRAIEGALGNDPTPAELRRFIRESRNLDAEEERALADEWLRGERESWRAS
jgi:metal-responsive CopG/Arc/MetJ family transcriptional regulator